LGLLDQALEQVGLRLDEVSLVVCTHAHLDLCGPAPAVVERTGCERWMHPRHEHLSVGARDLEAELAEGTEIARHSGADERGLHAYAERRRAAEPPLPAPLEPDRALLDGVTVESAPGTWDVVETPGHAPSHVCLHLPDRRLLLAGDVVLGRVALYFDYGWTPDPVGELLGSLDRVEGLDARLAVAGHGRPFGDRCASRRSAPSCGRACTRCARCTPSAPRPPTSSGRGSTRAWAPASIPYFFAKVLAYLRHLEILGHARRQPGAPERWVST
jgi:glyoxylase-like metal-dependent hydrolase (beta-lactamase superfamily II)